MWGVVMYLLRLHMYMCVEKCGGGYGELWGECVGVEKCEYMYM